MIGILVLVFVIVSGYLWSRSSPETADDALESEPTSYSDHGLAFDIPTGLHILSDAERASMQWTDLPPGVRSPTAGPWFDVLKLDPSNILVIYPDQLGFVIDETNLETYATTIASISEEVTGETLGVVPGTVGGFPSVDIEAHQVETPLGGRATNEVIEVFDGNLGYGFMCQYTDGSGMRDKCQEILDSVSIEPVDPEEAGWTTLDSGGGHRIDVPPGWSDESPAGAELIHSAFFLVGEDIPVAELQLFVEAIVGQPPPRRFVNDVVGRLSGAGFTLQDRATVRLPAGDAERLVFRMGNTRLVVFALVHGSQGITIWVATFSDQATMDLIAPTADAMARSLTVED